MKFNTKIIYLSIFAFLLHSSYVFADNKDAKICIKANKIKKTCRRYEVSLRDVMQLALENNFDIQIAKYDAEIAKTNKDNTESMYDTIIKAAIEHTDNQKASLSSFAGTKTVSNNYQLSAKKKIPTGTTLELAASNNREWSNSIYNTLNPSHDASSTFSITQALGKNFFGRQDRSKVKITQKEIESSEYLSLEKIEQYLVDVQTAYWDLVLCQEKMNIQINMLEQAKKLFHINKEKLSDGLVEKPDVLAAEANYEEQKNQLIAIKNTLKTKENVLRLLLNIEEYEDSLKIIPKEKFELLKTEENFISALNKAFENRYDYKKEKIDIENKDIVVSMKKNALWPQINLSLSFSRNGLARSLNQAIEDISDEDNPNFFAGIVFEFSLENREAKSELSKSKLQKAQALLSLKKLERKIAIGIQDKVRSKNVAYKIALNAKNISNLQSEKLKEEEKRFAQGRSNTDTIIRFQQDVNQSKLSFAESKYQYYLSMLALNKEEGILLRTYWDATEDA